MANKQIGLEAFDDLSAIKLEECGKALEVLMPAKGAAIFNKINASVNIGLAALKVSFIIGTALYKTYKGASKKEKEYLDSKIEELRVIKENLKKPDIEEEERNELIMQESMLVEELNKRAFLKGVLKWTTIGFFLGDPITGTLIGFIINKKKKPLFTKSEVKELFKE